LCAKKRREELSVTTRKNHMPTTGLTMSVSPNQAAKELPSFENGHFQNEKNLSQET
jgi:hypothetical protein